MKRALQLLIVLTCAVAGALMSACQSTRMVKTTTQRMGLTGTQETTVTEVPWESSWDRHFGEAIPAAMNSDFHP